ESIQTDWPRLLSLCKFEFELAIAHLPFHTLDFFEPFHIALAAVELRAEEGLDQLVGEARPDDAGAEAQDVHIVVLDALMGGVRVVAHRRANTRHLARCDGCAHAGAADEDAAFRVAAEDRGAELERLVR